MPRAKAKPVRQVRHVRQARPFSVAVHLVTWLTGVLVSLAVGFGMAGEALTIPWLNALSAGAVTIVAGWIVVILTLVSVILAIINKI